jgi:hypothetical protein
LDALAESTHAIEQQLRALQKALTTLAAQADVAQTRTEQLATLHRDDATAGDRLDRLVPILDAARIGAHVREAVGRSEFREAPCPHLVVSDLLPPDVYAAMIDAIPSPVFFEDRTAHRQELPVPPKLAPIYAIATWEFLAERVVRAVAAPALAQRFEGRLEGGHFEPGAAERTLSVRCPVFADRLLRRRPGYPPPPRHMPPGGTLMVIVYLVRAGDSEDYGTDLRGSGGLVTSVPFRANSALALLDSSGCADASIPEDAPADIERYTYEFRVGAERSD